MACEVKYDPRKGGPEQRVAARLKKRFSLETQAWEEEPTLPEGMLALPLLQMVYRGEVEVTPQQMRALIAALPFENPKLSAIATASMDQNSFAAALDRAINRSQGARPALTAPPPQLPAEELKAPFPLRRRNFR